MIEIIEAKDFLVMNEDEVYERIENLKDGEILEISMCDGEEEEDDEREE